MNNTNLAKALNNINEKVKSIETNIQENNSLLKENLKNSQDHQFIIKHGIHGYKEKIQQELGNFKSKFHTIIFNDSSLKYPHKKILYFLADQFEPQINQFQEVYFSKIVKECRIGKNKAKEYLDFLIQKGLLEKRDDGYRKFYRIKFMD